MIYRLNYETVTTAALAGRGHDPKVKPWSEKMGDQRARGFEGKLRKTFFRLPGYQRDLLQKQAATAHVRQRLAGSREQAVNVTWEDLRHNTARAIVERCCAAGIDPAKLFEVRYTGRSNEVAFMIWAEHRSPR